jgi:hypothetical protein
MERLLELVYLFIGCLLGLLKHLNRGIRVGGDFSVRCGVFQLDLKAFIRFEIQ